MNPIPFLFSATIPKDMRQTDVMNYIDDIEISTYFENYDGDIEHFKRKRDMTTEERTARREKWQKILKIGAVVGAGTALVIFAPELIAMVAPLMKSIKAALVAQGENPSKMKIGEILEKFHKNNVAKSVEGGDESAKGKNMIKGIIAYFKNLQEKKKSGGELTGLEKKMLEEADKATAKLESAAEGDIAQTVKNMVASGTAEESLSGSGVNENPNVKPKTNAMGGMDIKTILIVLVAIFVVSKFAK